MIYVFLDTNIYVRVVSQGRAGCEIPLFKDLISLVEGGVVRLLVPEVVTLELEGIFRVFASDIESKCDKLKNVITTAAKDTWSEIESLRTSLEHQVDSFRKKKQEESRRWADSVLRFLESDEVIRLRLTNEIHLDSWRRIIAKKMPNPQNADQDAAIVELLVDYFRTIQIEAPLLIFCSENKSDFAHEVKNDENGSKILELVPAIKDDLPNSRYSTDLRSSLEFAIGYESLAAPDSEELRAAKTALQGIDIDSPGYAARWTALDGEVEKAISNAFARRSGSSADKEACAIRIRLVDDFRSLLNRCRACESWDQTSEYKLQSRLEYVPENLVPFTGLAKIVRIKRNLEDYLILHMTDVPPARVERKYDFEEAGQNSWVADF